MYNAHVQKALKSLIDCLNPLTEQGTNMNALESSQAFENQGLLVTLSISSWKLSNQKCQKLPADSNCHPCINSSTANSCWEWRKGLSPAISLDLLASLHPEKRLEDQEKLLRDKAKLDLAIARAIAKSSLALSLPLERAGLCPF